MDELQKTDVVIIGAGPTGLFAVFQLGLLGLKAVVIDALEKPRGQCAELYPQKPIYDIPALPVVSGQELTDQLIEQSAPFEPQMELGQKVDLLQHGLDGRFVVGTSGGSRFSAAAVFIAAGAGCFAPRKPKLTELPNYEEHSIRYAVHERNELAGADIVIAGGGDSALDWGLDLAAGKQIKVDTQKFETTTPGIFAIGDINWYPGKLKLILSGFHETALAAQAAFTIARPDEKLRFQYTTSSSELQKRLKVA